MKHGRLANLVDKRFGRLVVIEEVERTHPRHRFWKCRCDCGTVTVVRQDHLGGKVLGCGCLQRERTSLRSRTHGRTRTREYNTWAMMRRRCLKTDSADYPEYGGRGITVCEAWQNSFEAFFSDMGPRPTKSHCIDRIDNDGPYEPANCRWATPKESANNRRNRGYSRWNPKPISEL